MHLNCGTIFQKTNMNLKKHKNDTIQVELNVE